MGCDTLSSLPGIAKLKPLKLVSTHCDYVDAFHALGTKQHLDDDVLKQLERFTIHMYGKQPRPDISLNDLCSTVRNVGSLLWNYNHHVSMFSSSIVIDQITKLYLEAVFQSNDAD